MKININVFSEKGDELSSLIDELIFIQEFACETLTKITIRVSGECQA